MIIYIYKTRQLKPHLVLPDKLQRILENFDPEDTLIIIERIEFEGSELFLKIKVSAAVHELDPETLELTLRTVRYRSSRLIMKNADAIEISFNSPLLWNYSDIQSALYFNGVCSDPHGLFVDLYNVHETIFGNLQHFNDTLNMGSNFEHLLNSGYGLLAKGPKALLTKYSMVLASYGISHSLVDTSIPKYWDGETRIPESGDAKILFIGDSYIIADKFIFADLSKEKMR